MSPWGFLEALDAETINKIILVIISVSLVLLAGLMSGLTLGLLTLDHMDLNVLKRAGSPLEQRYATAIEPVIRHQHWLLVTLLLMNACAMEALPIFLDRLMDPVSAVVFSVSFVLVFGEIIPQSVCSRYGLAVGAYSAWFVRALMYITIPISWPISKLLDLVLGHNHTALFRRSQLKALVDIHSEVEGLGGDLTDKEIRVMSGALDLTSKTGQQVMTPLDKVFMLSLDDTLNHATMDRILHHGHSRVPVHDPADRSDIVGLILVKELIAVNPEAGIRVYDFKLRSIPRLPADMPLYDLMALFETGRTHLSVLTAPADAPPGSAAGPSSPGSAAGGDASAPQQAQERAIGICTLEDIMEELLGSEIVDETDRYLDNQHTIKINPGDLARELPPALQTVLGQLCTPRVGLLGRTRSFAVRDALVRKQASLPAATDTPVYDVLSSMHPATYQGDVREAQAVSPHRVTSPSPRKRVPTSDSGAPWLEATATEGSGRRRPFKSRPAAKSESGQLDSLKQRLLSDDLEG